MHVTLFFIFNESFKLGEHLNFKNITMNNPLNKILSLFLLSLLTCSIELRAQDKLLQSVENIEEYHTHEGNSFKLIKIEQGCRIEAFFFLSFEQKIYNYYFNTQTLYKATEQTLRFEYKKDMEGSVDGITKIYPYSSAVYPLTDPEMQKDFKEYKALFPTAELKKCL